MNENIGIDDLDMRILELLEEDCTLSYREIAERLRRSMWSVRDRIDAMRRRGIIRGCRGVIDYGLIGQRCAMALSFNVPPDRVEEAERLLRGRGDVKDLLIKSGDRRFFAVIVGRECGELRRRILNDMAKVIGMYDVELDVVIERLKPRCPNDWQKLWQFARTLRKNLSET
ncbi:MAG: Lrp/AsnC family transcriptional regulator [Nitrososphaeria archaeon]|jgi:DNA-binding Lrp family transcriptional regulator